MTANRHHPDNAPPNDSTGDLAPWEYAGLLLTYWCNARCAFCYVHSGPDRGGQMPVETACKLWRELDTLAARHGRQMRIHLAGGEPFRDWPHLAAIVRTARDAGLSPLEKIETNAFWATSDGLVRARLELLDALGMELLVVSTDVYHQAFIPFDRVQRCVEIARQILGRGRVRVRWWDFYNSPVNLRGATPATREIAYRAALARHHDRLTGRAAQELVAFLPLHPPEHFRGDDCRRPLLGSKHVHIDPFGHIFPGVCNGIILGTAGPRTVGEIWDDLATGWPAIPVVSALVAGGSFELMQRAIPLGYRPAPEGYADKCHLCTHVRQFLVEHGHWPQHVGPAECYARPPAQRGSPSCPGE
ncbi:MAG: radical SAM protein [Phycisphaerae bacterium]|jgi:pyruvate-formate lyase-activating enzyme